MDTVWIQLDVVTAMTKSASVKTKEERQSFMFGPTGITRMITKGNYTCLMRGSKQVALVSSSQEEIMLILGKIRCTQNAINNKKSRVKK